MFYGLNFQNESARGPTLVLGQNSRAILLMSLLPILGVAGSQVALPYRSEVGCKDMTKI